jgi:oligopeptide transport system substrate-binding protein
MIMGCCLLLSACGLHYADQVKPAGGNTGTFVMVGTAEPPDLDPSNSTDTASARILANTMEGLMRLDEKNEPYPALAIGMPKVSADKRTYTFTLRSAQWSDGRPIRAQDFVYSWLRALNPKTKSQYSYMLYPIRNAEAYNLGRAKAEDVGVKALDERRLQVTLEAPTPYFNDLTAHVTFYPQRADIVTKYGSEYAKEPDRMVYNGPFMLTDWQHEANYTMKKNPRYWDADAVRLNEVRTEIIKDAASAINLYQTQHVDFSELGSDFADLFHQKPDRMVIKEMSSWYLEFNQRKRFFQNKHIRQAIQLAIDKRTMTERLLKNGSLPAGALVPTTVKATKEKTFRQLYPDRIDYDPKRARALYHQGLRELKMKDQPPKIEIVGDDTMSAKKELAYIKEQLRKNIGLRVQQVNIPFKQRLARGKRGQFDMLFSGWGADYNDPLTYCNLFMTGNSYNRGQWSNRQYDALVKQAMVNPDERERLQQLFQAEKILLDDAAIVPIYYRSRLGILKPFVKGITWNAIGSEYQLKHAYIDWKPPKKKKSS